MTDYSALGLNDQLRAVESIAGAEKTSTDSLDFDVNYQVPIEGVGYTQLHRLARPYKAVVSLSGDMGTYRDINAALNYASSVGGGAVFIRTGQYDSVGTSITIPSNVNVIGEDYSNTIINFGTSTNGININGKRNGGLRELTLMGSTGTTNGALFINNSNNLRFANIYFSGNGVGILFGGTSSYDCLFDDIQMGTPTTYGLYLQASRINSGNKNVFRNIYVDTPTQYGFYILGQERNTYQNCRVDLAGKSGWYINASQDDRSFFNFCEARQSGSAGFEIVATERCNFANCMTFSNTASGFLISSMVYSIIADCQSTDNGHYGISLGTASNRNIINNISAINNSSGSVTDSGTANIVTNIQG